MRHQKIFPFLPPHCEGQSSPVSLLFKLHAQHCPASPPARCTLPPPRVSGACGGSGCRQRRRAATGRCRTGSLDRLQWPVQGLKASRLMGGPGLVDWRRECVLSVGVCVCVCTSVTVCWCSGVNSAHRQIVVWHVHSFILGAFPSAIQPEEDRTRMPSLYRQLKSAFQGDWFPPAALPTHWHRLSFMSTCPRVGGHGNWTGACPTHPNQPRRNSPC